MTDDIDVEEQEAEWYGLTGAEISEAYERYGPARQLALALAEEKGVKNLTFEELLAASSLGSPLALYLRDKCPPEVLEEIRAGAWGDDDGGNAQ